MIPGMKAPRGAELRRIRERFDPRLIEKGLEMPLEAAKYNYMIGGVYVKGGDLVRVLVANLISLREAVGIDEEP